MAVVIAVTAAAAQEVPVRFAFIAHVETLCIIRNRLDEVVDGAVVRARQEGPEAFGHRLLDQVFKVVQVAAGLIERRVAQAIANRPSDYLMQATVRIVVDVADVHASASSVQRKRHVLRICVNDVYEQCITLVESLVYRQQVEAWTRRVQAANASNVLDSLPNRVGCKCSISVCDYVDILRSRSVQFLRICSCLFWRRTRMISGLLCERAWSKEKDCAKKEESRRN